MDDGKLLGLVLLCIPLSLVSFGGGQTIVASLQHQTVDVQHLLTSRQFTDLYAISRASPGPSTLIVALIGWGISGFWGAVIATLAIFIPSSALICIFGSWWQRYRLSPWGRAVERGLTPIAVGLIVAGGLAVSQSAGLSLFEIATTLVAAAFLILTRVGPYPVLGTVGALYFCLSAAGRI